MSEANRLTSEEFSRALARVFDEPETVRVSLHTGTPPLPIESGGGYPASSATWASASASPTTVLGVFVSDGSAFDEDDDWDE